MAADVQLNDLVPFVAPVLLQGKQGDEVAPLFEGIVAVAREQAGTSSSVATREVVKITDVDEDGELRSQAIIYSEVTKPSWLNAAARREGRDLEEKSYQLIVVAVRGNMAAVSASDAAMRERIADKQAVARRLSRDTLRAFIGGEAKALWLNGVHTPTSSKADTKNLTGSALEDALDPIGDQTYFLAAGRTVPAIEGLKKDGRPAVVGVSPAGARLWLRRADTWEDYKSLLNVIFDIAAAPPPASDLFGVLSQPIDDIAAVLDAYGVAVVPLELLSEEAISNADYDLARRWAYDARYDVQPVPGGASLRVSVSLNNQPVGDVQLEITLDDGNVVITPQWLNETANMAIERAEAQAFLEDPQRIKIFYDSGHCLAQGRFYEGGYVDQRFDWDFRSFHGYDVGVEKPKVPAGKTLADRIAQHGDNSLFAFVVEKMFVDEQGQPAGWLASDDGSMEAADFIHLDNALTMLTLVHVKAASNATATREAAPSDYEIVVGQAVKNLRHLERRNLVEELKAGRLKKIGAAVWHDGVKQPNRDGFLAAAGKLKASAKKQLVVLQPRVTATEHEFCWAQPPASPRAKRIKQIDTLLLAAHASAQACGATFAAIGAE